ncbi:MAG: hypothetical protein DRR16_10605, partial [Candidatus Parabeggiatoa sp. nov. 3]
PYIVGLHLVGNTLPTLHFVCLHLHCEPLVGNKNTFRAKSFARKTFGANPPYILCAFIRWATKTRREPYILWAFIWWATKTRYPPYMNIIEYGTY